MIPKKIHYSWFSGDTYPAELKACMDTWKKVLQATIRSLLLAFREQGFNFPKMAKMKLAYGSVNTYFVLNRVYLKLKGIK